MKVLPYRLYRTNERKVLLLHLNNNSASVEFPYVNEACNDTYTPDGRYMVSDVNRTHPKTIKEQVQVPHNTELTLNGKNYVSIEIDNDSMVVEIINAKELT